MEHDKSLDEFADALGRIQPSAPDLSPGSVMFEAGRHVGSAEAMASRANSLKVWKSVAAASIVFALVSLSIWLVPRNQGNNMVVRDDSPDREAEIINEQTPAPGDSLASQTPGDDKPVAVATGTRLIQAFFVADQSPLAQRQQMLRQGVGGLPEIATNQILPVMTSSGRGELMNQLLENESL